MLDINRFRGGFLGLCLGDALGAPHEFEYSVPLRYYTGKLEHALRYKTRYGKIEYGVLGQVTDDSTMSIALLLTLMSNKKWDEETVITAYLAWANSGIRFLGKNTRSLLKGIKTIKGYRARSEKFKRDNIQSNGSLMRIYPIIYLLKYFSIKSVFELARRDTNLTNPNDINTGATYVYIAILWLICNGIGAIEGIQKLYILVSNPIVIRAIQSGYTDYIYIFIKCQSGKSKWDVKDNKGWVLHAIYLLIIAWLLIDHNKSTYSQIINWVITRGGDTDTNGAIIGSMLGFYLGEENLQKEPITGDNINIMLSADWNKGAFPLDYKYHPANILNVLV